MTTRFYLPSTGTAGASPAVSASWNYSVSAFVRRAAVTTKISSAFATISLDGNTDSADTNYCYVQWVSDPIAAQTISAQTVDWVVSLFEENARANQYLAMCIRVVSGDGSTVRGTVVALQRDGTELGTSQSSRYDTVTSTEVVSSAGDRIVIEIGTGGNPDIGAGGDSHDADVRIGDNSATDFGESGSETSDYCGWVEFANTLTFASTDITGTASITLDGIGISAAGTVEVVGTASITLDGVGLSATGTVEVQGAADITLEGVGIAATGTVEAAAGISGEASITLDGVGISAAGTVADYISDYDEFITDELGAIAHWPLTETSGTTVVNQGSLGTSANGTATGLTWAQTPAPGGGMAPLLDGSNDYANIYSAALAAAFSGDLCTVLIWWKVYDSGTWSDSTQRATLTLLADGNNYIQHNKETDANTYRVRTVLSANSIATTTTSYADTSWHLSVLTLDKTANERKHYMDNAAQIGATLASADWVGSLLSTRTCLGVSNTSPVQAPWYGYLSRASVFDKVLTAAEIAEIYNHGIGVFGSASITLDGIGLSATGTVEAGAAEISGTADITLDGIGISAAGTVEVQGAAGITLDGVGLAAAGTVEVQGAAGITLDGIGLSAAGTVEVQGAATISLDSVGLSATGTVEVQGAAGITLDGVGLVATGAVEVQGAATITLDGVGLSAAGTVDVAGAATITLDSIGLSAAGTVDIAGVATITLDGIGLVATGAVGDVPISGEASITLEGIGISATGTVDVAGAAAISLDGIGLSAAGTVEVQGAATISLGDVGLSASGTVDIAGLAAITLEGVGVVAAGLVEVQGAASITLEGVVISAQGAVEVLATASITLDGISLAATGTVITVAAMVAGYAALTDEAYMAVVVSDIDAMSAALTNEACMAVVVEDAHG